VAHWSARTSFGAFASPAVISWCAHLVCPGYAESVSLEAFLKWPNPSPCLAPAKPEVLHSRRRKDLYRAALAVFVSVGLGACASEVVRRPTQFVSAQDSPGTTVEVLADTKIEVGSGYERVIRRGSVWQLVGRTPEGEIYKPNNQVFTVEGAHVHEAYLVLDGDRVVGFYLPVEHAFSPAPAGNGTRLSVQRRSP
jgi:hypothetical protein